MDDLFFVAVEEEHETEKKDAEVATIHRQQQPEVDPLGPPEEERSVQASAGSASVADTGSHSGSVIMRGGDAGGPSTVRARCSGNQCYRRPAAAGVLAVHSRPECKKRGTKRMEPGETSVAPSACAHQATPVRNRQIGGQKKSLPDSWKNRGVHSEWNSIDFRDDRIGGSELPGASGGSSSNGAVAMQVAEEEKDRGARVGMKTKKKKLRVPVKTKHQGEDSEAAKDEAKDEDEAGAEAASEQMHSFEKKPLHPELMFRFFSRHLAKGTSMAEVHRLWMAAPERQEAAQENAIKMSTAPVRDGDHFWMKFASKLHGLAGKGARAKWQQMSKEEKDRYKKEANDFNEVVKQMNFFREGAPSLGLTDLGSSPGQKVVIEAEVATIHREQPEVDPLGPQNVMPEGERSVQASAGSASVADTGSHSSANTGDQ